MGFKGIYIARKCFPDEISLKFNLGTRTSVIISFVIQDEKSRKLNLIPDFGNPKGATNWFMKYHKQNDKIKL